MFRPGAWDLPISPLYPGCRVLRCQLPHSDKGTSSPKTWWKASLEGHQSLQGKTCAGGQAGQDWNPWAGDFLSLYFPL